jgi:carbon-monoxide dehydrogenase medium subunit
MIPAQFDYVRPADLDEALRILRKREGEAKVLAGGFSLLPLLKLRLAQPALLVDLRDVAGLDSITRTDDDIRIGGRVTHRRILEDDGIASALPVMRDAAAGIGDAQIRNWGTIGGSCAHADPSADWPAVLLALRASFVLRSESGERVVPARDFFVDTFTTAIEPSEVLTEVRIPLPPPGTGSAYQKLERRAGDFSTVGVAAQLTIDADGRVAAAGIGLTAVAETPFAATDAEADLVHGAATDEAFRRAAEAAMRQSRPVGDSHGPADYKRAMVVEMSMRALHRAADRALSR